MSVIIERRSSSTEDVPEPSRRPCNCQYGKKRCLRTTIHWFCMYLVPPVWYCIDSILDARFIYKYWNSDENVSAWLCAIVKAITFVTGIVYLTNSPTTSKNSSLNDKSGNNEELIKIKKQTSWISSAVDINNSDNAPLDDSPLNTKEQTSLLSPPTNDNSSDGASISNDPLNNKEQTSFVSSIANENDMDDRLDTNEQSSFTSASSSINSSHGTHTNDSRLNNSERPSWTSRKRKISKSSTVDNSDSDSASSNNDSLNTKEQSLCRRCVGCLEVRVPIIWYFKMLIKSCSSNMPNKRQYASDKGWVQMTENFLETAPQTTILIYIILKTFNTGVIVDICFRIISVGFLCLSTVMYNQAIRKDQDIPPLILEWKILFWLLSFGQIGPRIVLLSSFAYELPFWFGVGIASHFFIMFITLFITVRNEQDICQNQCGMLFHRAVFSCVYIYYYVSILEYNNPAIIVFYITTFLENAFIIFYMYQVSSIYIISASFVSMFVWSCTTFIFCWLLVREHLNRNRRRQTVND